MIRTYAFFNRNAYILTLLVTALAGVVAYQLYVATSQMLRECCRKKLLTLLTSYVGQSFLSSLQTYVIDVSTSLRALLTGVLLDYRSLLPHVEATLRTSSR